MKTQHLSVVFTGRTTEQEISLVSLAYHARQTRKHLTLCSIQCIVDAKAIFCSLKLKIQ